MYNTQEHVLMMNASGTQAWHTVQLSTTGKGLCNNSLVEARHAHHSPLSGLYKANMLLQSNVSETVWELSHPKQLCAGDLTPHHCLQHATPATLPFWGDTLK